MREWCNAKNKLINELWLPSTIRGGNFFYPRIINKKMKFLTLTNDENFEEVIEFTKNKLIVKQSVFAWIYNRIKAWRIDSEGRVFKVFPANKYEESISSSHEISQYFPFDIINLDYSSQDPEIENGRLEKEIIGLEKTIKLQKQKRGDKKGFILILSTIINSKEIDRSEIVSNCNELRMGRWGGLSLDGFEPKISDKQDKIKIVESILNQLASKYDFEIDSEKKFFKIDDDEYIFSIVGIISYR